MCSARWSESAASDGVSYLWGTPHLRAGKLLLNVHLCTVPCLRVCEWRSEGVWVSYKMDITLRWKPRYTLKLCRWCNTVHNIDNAQFCLLYFHYNVKYSYSRTDWIFILTSSDYLTILLVADPSNSNYFWQRANCVVWIVYDINDDSGFSLNPFLVGFHCPEALDFFR